MLKKIFFGIFILFLVFTIGSVVFIKFDTQVAAEFTDNILRPMLGNNNVIYLEKVFFNSSDKIQQFTTNTDKISAPKFNNLLYTSNNQTTGLDLTPIPQTIHSNTLKNEGKWQTAKLKTLTNQDILSYVFLRSDNDRPYSIVTIAQLDMSKLTIGIVAGIKEPGGKIGNPGPGKIPKDIIQSNKLIAAFDGGFQYRDGEYGMVVDGKTYVPLKKNLGTFVAYKNGTIKIIDYIGQDLGPNVAFIRQNCPILIDNGTLGVDDVKNKKLWGRTFTSDIYTWRTGLGITKNGNLLFAVGNSLTPTTLGKALKMAGAENAIQLDINPNWVRFNIFHSLGNGKYDSKPLTKDLKDGSIAYQTGYSKDFFYVFEK